MELIQEIDQELKNADKILSSDTEVEGSLGIENGDLEDLPIMRRTDQPVPSRQQNHITIKQVVPENPEKAPSQNIEDERSSEPETLAPLAPAYNNSASQVTGETNVTGFSEKATVKEIQIEQLAQQALREEALRAAYLAAQEQRQRLDSQRQRARLLRTEATEYLPQLVSAVLHSPLAMSSSNPHNPHGVDPIFALRKLLLSRCIQDPSFGILLCWLLEAEVGRAWKPEFEHLQQTGRRLILVVPPTIQGRFLAKVGHEKEAAFHFLKDAEEATAFGTNWLGDVEDPDLPPKLPPHMAIQRCNHFGDTMFFIDRLTQISLDLRAIPVIHRTALLREYICDLNRKLRRRMVSKGAVTLDAEDEFGPHEWPKVSDVSRDLLSYSVHFPLEPMCLKWPGGLTNDIKKYHEGIERNEQGVVRVLNIVPTECRLLSSRERCPFLVQMEVLQTSLSGSDPRLYIIGQDGPNGRPPANSSFGPRISTPPSTVPDAKPLGSHPQTSVAPDTAPNRHFVSSVFDTDDQNGISDSHQRAPSVQFMEQADFVRGGWQEDDYTYAENYGSFDNYERIRQHSIEQLHQQMPYPNTRQNQADEDSTSFSATRNLPMGSDLLNHIYGAPWPERCEHIRLTSPFGNVPGWRLASFIIKAGEDIRREALVMQVISKLRGWFEEEIPSSQRPYLRPYTIMCIGGDSGLLECVPDAKSVDEVKKECLGFTTLRNYFERAYGSGIQQQQQHYDAYSLPESISRSLYNEVSFEKAQDNFLRSLVGYSLVCYILQVKDRHNANILLDREGHLLHIDFGFVLGDTPKMGKVPIFSERAPFKLTAEFWEVIGGWNIREGGLGVKFCKMLEASFACASSHSEEIASMIEAAVLNITRNSAYANRVAEGVKSRLRMRGAPDSKQQKQFIMDLVDNALTSWGTSTYDWLQKNMHGYQ